MPLVVAVCALLVASGRADFSENEIRREVDLLAGELRTRYGFTDEQRIAGGELWGELLDRLAQEGATVPPIGESTLDLWVRPFYSPGLVGKKLWIKASKEGVAEWAERRYRGLFNEVLAGLRPDEGIEIGIMGLSSRADGKP